MDSRKAEQEYIEENCIELVRRESFYIYGTGNVARRFYGALQQMGCEDHVLGFIVTEIPQGASPTFLGKTIQPVDQIPRDTLIFLAVHYVWQMDIERHLTSLGFYRYAMIYWNLFDFCFGRPKERGVRVSPMEIINKMSKQFYVAIAAYDLAIRQYADGKDGLDAYYLKYHSAIGSPATARERLEQFHVLIDRYRRGGDAALRRYPLKLNECGLVLDGLHRTMIAAYFHVPFLFADVYETHDPDGLQWSMAAAGCKLDEIFTPDERRELECYREEILGRPSRT